MQGTGSGKGVEPASEREISLSVAADAQILTALVRRSHSGTEDQFREEESVSGKSVMNAEPDLLCTRPAGNPDGETGGPYAVNNSRRTRSPDEGAGESRPVTYRPLRVNPGRHPRSHARRGNPALLLTGR